jgi:5-methyltetrahydropteroyltriglutamate--homocysteine methyltransferase
MVTSANLGFPRIGLKRELKKSLESFWKGESDESALRQTAKELRARHWKLQQDAGIEHIPSNDFSFYDHVLDTTVMLGAVPERYGFAGNSIDLETYFSMARGNQKNGKDVVAMEMTKWFDTNYHYIVPEFRKGQTFKLSSTKIIDEFLEANSLGITTRPVLLGPVSYLLLGKAHNNDLRPIELLDALLPVYAEVLSKLKDAGATWVQIDEPCLVLDLSDEEKGAYLKAYRKLGDKSGLKVIIATYFGDLRDNLQTLLNLPVAGIHIDAVRAPNQLDAVLKALPQDRWLSLGIVDGRNIWKNDLSASAAIVEKAADAIGPNRLIVSPSCSLLHSPVDLAAETKLDTEFKGWLSFATQKLNEIALLTRIENEGPEDFGKELAENAKAIASRKTSTRIHNQAVKQRLAQFTEADSKRHSEFKGRIAAQQKLLNLPLLPTTTIGSFPQTQEIRETRAKFKKGDLTTEQYDAFLASKTEELIRWQEKIGIDVPVHGEYERNDMVEYFGEQLSGYAFTENGWVQSYGSRCVKPPIIFGDVERPLPMTVRWSEYAQTLTKLPVKGMLTGPVTMLQWSFVRDDQPRAETCKQIALAIRDEVKDLEKANIRVIQIDEPAFREGLPLRHTDRAEYLKWAVECFRISSSGIEDSTQIHTHMCYSEFNDIIDSIADLDADVISIETSRSAMELLEAFVEFKYPNEIGPGVYDIHSPRIPKTEEMEKLLYKALDVLDEKQVWVNPDCGLKTRNWKEVEPALINMVEAAKKVRSELEFRRHNTKESANA